MRHIQGAIDSRLSRLADWSGLGLAGEEERVDVRVAGEEEWVEEEGEDKEQEKGGGKGPGGKEGGEGVVEGC